MIKLITICTCSLSSQYEEVQLIYVAKIKK